MFSSVFTLHTLQKSKLKQKLLCQRHADEKHDVTVLWRPIKPRQVSQLTDTEAGWLLKVWMTLNAARCLCFIIFTVKSVFMIRSSSGDVLGHRKFVWPASCWPHLKKQNVCCLGQLRTNTLRAGADSVCVSVCVWISHWMSHTRVTRLNWTQDSHTSSVTVQISEPCFHYELAQEFADVLSGSPKVTETRPLMRHLVPETGADRLTPRWMHRFCPSKHFPLRCAEKEKQISCVQNLLNWRGSELRYFLSLQVLDYWVFGRIFCDIWAAVDVLCCTASIMSLCVISIDRYIGVRYPLQYPMIVTRRRALLAMLGVWILAIVISIGPLLGWKQPPSQVRQQTVASMNLVSFSRQGGPSSSLPAFYSNLLDSVWHCGCWRDCE